MSRIYSLLGWRLVAAGLSAIASLLLTTFLIVTGGKPTSLTDVAAKGPAPTPSPAAPQVIKVVVKEIPVAVHGGHTVAPTSRVNAATPPPVIPSQAPQPAPSPTTTTSGSRQHG